jgi:rhamnose utilization protein RhaD (predicted bifunctional aldolase and dehydrogenase)
MDKNIQELIDISRLYGADPRYVIAGGGNTSYKDDSRLWVKASGHALATIDEDYAVEGREVEVLWGRPGTHQMRVRATVANFPYIKEDRNDSFDVERIPRPQF